MTDRQKIWVLIGACAFIIGAVFVFIDPVAQNLGYHHFSDGRNWLGIDNFGDVVSNALFVPAGLYGLWALSKRTFEPTRIPLAVFFIGVIFVAPGSAYYHVNPTNWTLLWDRLPMSVAFMGLTAAILTDRVNARFGVRVALPALIVLGAVSVVYWYMTEIAQAGDLRAYGLVQYLPMAMIPVMLWLFPKVSTLGWRALGSMFVFYALAKALEHYDHQVMTQLGGVVSGHTLKHLFAAMAPIALGVHLRR